MFYLYEFLHFLKVEIYQINTNQSPKNGENYILKLLSSQKLISCKIWVIETKMSKDSCGQFGQIG